MLVLTFWYVFNGDNRRVFSFPIRINAGFFWDFFFILCVSIASVELYPFIPVCDLDLISKTQGHRKGNTARFYVIKVKLCTAVTYMDTMTHILP